MLLLTSAAVGTLLGEAEEGASTTRALHALGEGLVTPDLGVGDGTTSHAHGLLEVSLGKLRHGVLLLDVLVRNAEGGVEDVPATPLRRGDDLGIGDALGDDRQEGVRTVRHRPVLQYGGGVDQRRLPQPAFCRQPELVLQPGRMTTRSLRRLFVVACCLLPGGLLQAADAPPLLSFIDARYRRIVR